MSGLFLLTLAACSPFRVLGSDDVVVIDGEDRIGVKTEWLDFGSVSASALPGEKLLEVSNLGDTEVAVFIDGVGLTDTPFFLLSESRIFSLAVGETTQIPVYFAPTTDGVANAELVLQPGDVTVQLHAVGTAPVATVEPLDVGNVPLGCTAERSLLVTNTGSEPLTIDGASTSSSGFTVDASIMSLDAGESGEVRLAFTPDAAVSYAGEVLLLTNDPQQPRLSVAVAGAGDDGQETVESFEYQLGNPTDILMLVDNGASMAPFMGRGLAALETFVETLGDGGTDFHLAALGLDGECASGNLSFATADDSAASTEAMMKPAFTVETGEFADDLLPIALDAMEGGDGNCLADFRREEADLHVIAITDGPNELEFADNLEELNTHVLPPYMLTISTVTPTDLCGARAWDWVDAATETDGEVRDACTLTWTSAFDAIADLASEAHPASFYLSGRPMVSTIEVLVEGVSSTTWTYEEDINAVVFPTDKRPPRGASIEVRYVDEATCAAE